MDDFVIKRFIHAISETVSEALGYMQKEIGTDANVMQAAGELGARSKSVISESAMKIKMRTELDSKSGTRVFKVKNTATDDADRNHDDQMDIDDDDDVDGVGKGKGKKAAATTAKATTARGGGRKPAAPKPATASGRGKATATASKATAGRGRGKKAMVDSEDEEEDDDNDALEDFDDDEDDDFTGSKSKRGAGRGVAAQPKSTTSRNYAASSNTTKPSPVILSRAVASNNNRRAVHNSELEEFSDPVKVNEAVDDILDDSEDDDFRPTHKKIVKQSKSGSGTSNALSAIANSSHGRTSQLPKPVATSTNTTYSAPSAVIDLADDDDDEKEDVWGFGGGTTSGSAGIAIQPIPSYLAKKRGGNGSNHYDDAEDDEEDGTAKGKGNGRAVEQSEKKSRRLSGWD